MAQKSSAAVGYIIPNDRKEKKLQPGQNLNLVTG
jgi:hypothetical protein